MNLLGQFARRCNDQGAHNAQPALEQTVEDRQHEGGGLAGAGLGQAEDVTALRGRGDGLLLDGGGRDVARRSGRRQKARVEGQLVKIH